MAEIAPFKITIAQSVLERIRKRVADYRWFDAPKGGPDWQFGMSAPALKHIQSYWLNTYDWRSQEVILNRYPHYKAKIDDIDIHFVHVVGEAGGKRPLLLTHGWPGSMYEFWDTIGPLAYPSKHGGSVDEAFDLIIPSLPGFGFSGKPASPLGPRATAALWDKLMRRALGYDTYRAQGGDWGSMVTSWLGFDHSAHNDKGGCAAIHLNMIGLRPTPATPQSDEELAWITKSQRLMQSEGSYFLQQSTKPQTLAMALMDSPMGTAAWILEKFKAWSDLGQGELLDVYTEDQLITNLMIYLVNDAIATSVWFYAGFLHEGGPALPTGERCETPTTFANFPGEPLYTPPPRSWVERAYNLIDWQEIPRGGHFAAMEQPDLFTKSLRDWANHPAS